MSYLACKRGTSIYPIFLTESRKILCSSDHLVFTCVNVLASNKSLPSSFSFWRIYWCWVTFLTLFEQPEPIIEDAMDSFNSNCNLVLIHYTQELPIRVCIFQWRRVGKSTQCLNSSFTWFTTLGFEVADLEMPPHRISLHIAVNAMCKFMSLIFFLVSMG